MSLINDALKRAKETQPQGVAAAGLSLHPVAVERRQSSDFLLMLLAVVILLLASLLLWEWFFGARYELKVRANSFPTASQTLPPQPAPTMAPVAAPAAPAPIVAAAPAPEKIESETTVLAKPAVAEEAAAAPTEAEAPKPPPITYRLQGIFYYKKNPSAVINGKTVFVGSLVGDVQVVAIGKDSATIMTASGQTRVLDLP